ncbi:hypothetical protein ACNH6C_08110 [Bdellovibrio bacteriovorus]|uniref:hypothetical protein n=1 Tax=Bdellovibrio bacteriovorus TaxID=959 RepID=UPI003A7F8DA2
MFSIKRIFKAALLTVVVSLTACTEKLETGSLLRDFTGAEGVEVLSPTAVRVYWQLHSRYREYKVYYNLSSEAVAETFQDSVIIRNLSPNTAYTFKVVGTDGTNSVGGNKEITVTTNKPFAGAGSVSKDADGNLILIWDYPNKVAEYQIFFKEYEDPTAANTSNWTAVDRTSLENRYIFRNMTGSTRYHFVVQAKYMDDTYERPTKVVTASTNSSFPTPAYELSPISIGALPFAKVTPVVNAEYKNENYVSRVYMGSTAVSDPLVGAGTIVFSPSANWTIGKIEDLSIRVNYNDGAKNETLIFDNLSTYIKGIPGYKEMPPVAAVDAGVAYMGEAMTSGDFNCDGHPDLAVGLPNISIASLGVKSANAGAVYVYYSYKPTGSASYKLKTFPDPVQSPAAPGVDPQIITFEDLSHYARFGKSMSGSGNLNGDTRLGNACEDLVVGAPGQDTSYSPYDYDGAAFVFFGSAEGLKAPTKIKDMQQNFETCNGLVEGATCSAVMLWPDTSLWPSSHWDQAGRVQMGNNAEFGHAVSFVGDFNGDGYDDIAVGAPRGDWDGVPSPNLPGESKYERETGFVAMYFGSKSGIGYETPTAGGIPNSGNPKFRFLKIYAPTPHYGARFGHAVHGGADVDGGFRIRNSAGKLVGGSDMIVGAPGDRYIQAQSAKIKATTASCSTPDTCAAIPPAEGGWGSSGFSFPSGTNHYSLPVNNAAVGVGSAPGAAYIYFGRSAPSASATEDETYRNQFWFCGNRKMDTNKHFSCLTNKSGFRILFPRSYYKDDQVGSGVKMVSRGFGTSVALVGDRSRYDATNTALTSPSDTNADGWAEAVVSSSYFNNGSKTNSGALWVFYGNPFKLYEMDAFKGIDAVDPAIKDSDWNDGSSQCDRFDVNNNLTKRKCAPTLIRSNSIGSNYYLGLYPEAMAVADVTGDGIKDVVVGATGDGTKASSSGAAYVFTSLAGVGLTSNFLHLYNYQGQAYDYFGRSVAVGNFDGDYAGLTPLNDVFVGSYLDKSAKLGGGAALGYYSKGQPLSSVNSVPVEKMVDRAASPQSLNYESIRIVGDINRDGYADAVAQISRPSGNSKTYTTDAVVFFGSNLGLVTTSFCKENLARVFKAQSQNENYCYPSVNPAQGVTLNDIALPQMISKPTNLSVGWASRAFDAGDINGDGFGDVVFLDPASGGQMVAYYGSRGGLQAVTNPKWIPAAGDPQYISTRWSTITWGDATIGMDEDSPHRRKVINHGDFNGDGYSDIVLSVPSAPSFFTMNKGTSINDVNPPFGDPPAANDGWQCYDEADSSCKNGNQAVYMGRVFIWYGSSTGVQTPKVKGYTPTDNEPNVNTNLLSANANYLIDTYGTESAAVANKACSGAPNNSCKMQYLYSPMVRNVNYGYERMRHMFGASVAVMDYNKDGIDDLVISAPGWEDLACYYDADNYSNYGRLFLYKGSTNGIQAADRDSYYNATYMAGSCVNTTQSQFQNLDPSLDLDGAAGRVYGLMPPILNQGLSNNMSGRYFGYRIASAGDLNNDGYEDLIVTAPREAPKAGLTDTGMSYVYYGPLCGSDNNSAMWDYLEINLNKQMLYTDPNLPGGGAGIECMRTSGTPKPAPQAFYAWDAKSGDLVGSELMTGRMKKGDFNGDGFDDVILGSYGFDDSVNGITQLGRGLVFFGSSVGLHSADYPDTVVVGDAQGRMKPYVIQYEDTETSPYYFYMNTSSGDVNGDGTMDILVPSEGHDGHAPINGIDVGNFFLLY